MNTQSSCFQSYHFSKCFKSFRFKVMILSKYHNHACVLILCPHWNHQALRNKRLSKWKKVKFLNRCIWIICANSRKCWGLCVQKNTLHEVTALTVASTYLASSSSNITGKKHLINVNICSGRLIFPWCYLCHHQHTWSIFPRLSAATVKIKQARHQQIVRPNSQTLATAFSCSWWWLLL